MKGALRWEPVLGSGTKEAGARSLSHWGYSGDVVIAMVFQRQGTDRWHWSINHNVHTKHITQGYGETVSRARSCAAAERAWSRWLEATGLQPKEQA